MSEADLKKQIITQLDTLSVDLQRKVLDFMEGLTIVLPRGISGRSLLRFDGVIEPEDAQLMKKAIEEGCERVDDVDW